MEKLITDELTMTSQEFLGDELEPDKFSSGFGKLIIYRFSLNFLSRIPLTHL